MHSSGHFSCANFELLSISGDLQCTFSIYECFQTSYLQCEQGLSNIIFRFILNNFVRIRHLIEWSFSLIYSEFGKFNLLGSNDVRQPREAIP